MVLDTSGICQASFGQISTTERGKGPPPFVDRITLSAQLVDDINSRGYGR